MATNTTRRAKLGCLTLSLVAALGLGEIVFRVAGVSNPNFYGPDPELGWALIPGASGLWTKEGRAEVRINRDGFRGADVPAAKPPGTFRIALLGDSCVEALQVPEEKTFAKLLEAELAGCPAFSGRQVETLNFGVSGYGTAQELLALRTRVERFAPDLVLTAFYSGNDVRNNSKELDQDPLRPYASLVPGPQGTPRLAFDASFREHASYRFRRSWPARAFYALVNRSRLLQGVKQGKSRLDGLIGSWKARRVEKGAAVQELGLDNAVYAPQTDPLWTDAWAVTEALLAETARESAARGARFALVSLTTPIQVDPDPKKRAAFAKELGVPDLDEPDRRLAAFAAERGIDFLALAPTLRDLAEREGVYLHGFVNTEPGEGHWNERGHAAAAREIGRWLCGGSAEPSPVPFAK